MKIVFCGFGNPDNRGCEAILRSTSKMVKNVFPKSNIVVMSNDYGRVPMLKIDEIDEYEYSYYPHSENIDRYIFYGLRKIFKSAESWCFLRNIGAYKRIGTVDLCISIGGDNFCYGNTIDHFLVHHRHYKKTGAKLIHWGSSFESEFMSNKLVDDLNQFDAIMVRESISFDLLNELKIVSPVYFVPDPAFTMLPMEINNFEKIEQDCVGVNISPMIIDKESQNGIVAKNFINLIDHITAFGRQVCLIPHVSSRQNGVGDYSIMKNLMKEVKYPQRCLLFGYSYSAPEIKYIISKCSLFIGARTHATIAAYSTCVPTAVLGYSVKAQGIARDLLGDKENYVISVQKLNSEKEFIRLYNSLCESQKEIKSKLQREMPSYIKKAYEAENIIRKVIEK